MPTGHPGTGPTKENMYQHAPLLEEDADDMLLMLLSHDKEPIHQHWPPYRRYIQPSMHHWDDNQNINDLVPKWKYDPSIQGWIKNGDSYGQLPKSRTVPNDYHAVSTSNGGIKEGMGT